MSLRLTIRLLSFLQIEGKAQRNPNSGAHFVMNEITKKIKESNTKEKGLGFLNDPLRLWFEIPSWNESLVSFVYDRLLQGGHEEAGGSGLV